MARGRKVKNIAAIWRSDHDIGGVVLTFEYPEGYNPVYLAKEVVRDYLKTPEGRQVYAGEFNWGDAASCIPHEWWEKNKLKLLALTNLDHVVDYDEDLSKWNG